MLIVQGNTKRRDDVLAFISQRNAWQQQIQEEGLGTGEMITYTDPIMEESSFVAIFTDVIAIGICGTDAQAEDIFHLPLH